MASMDPLSVPPTLTALPAEIIFLICSLLEAEHLAALSTTCRRLNAYAGHDSLWQPLVQANLPGCTLTTPAPAASYRELFAAHYPRWFLPRYKLWFGDDPRTGMVLVARYDADNAVIEAHRLVAEPGVREMTPWEHDPAVRIVHFSPRVRVHVEETLIRLESGRLERPGSSVTRSFQAETDMVTRGSEPGIFRNFILARRVPQALQHHLDAVWPPHSVPARQRVSGTPLGHGVVHSAPAGHRHVSDMAFRLRKWMEFLRDDGRPVGVRMNEVVSTYATLAPELYTPTRRYPYRGIWVGDFSTHGAECLVLTQGPRDGEVVVDAPPGPSGRLTAIKLTGDPNVPRGQVSFEADDIGDGGLVRIASDATFSGARIVRGHGHIADRVYSDPRKIDTQLILISHDRIAQYWMDLGHICFYERVELDRYIG